LRFVRLFTHPDTDPFDTVAFRRLTTEAGETVTVPARWGSVAVEVLVDQVFYPHALPPATRRAADHPLGARLPDFLWPQEADDTADVTAPRFERDIRDVLHRVAGGLAYHAFCAGLLDNAEDARAFYDELRHVMLHRIALPEISLLATAGLQWAYGLADAPRYRPAESIDAFPADFAVAGAALGGTLAVDAQTPVTDLQKRLRLLADMRAIENPDAPPLTGSEDFAFMTERVPGSYVLVGAGPGAMPHNPGYDFNDAILTVAASYFCRLVETELA